MIRLSKGLKKVTSLKWTRHVAKIQDKRRNNKIIRWRPWEKKKKKKKTDYALNRVSCMRTKRTYAQYWSGQRFMIIYFCGENKKIINITIK